MTRGLDNCLFGYPMDEWKRLEEKLKALPVTKKDARAFTRFSFPVQRKLNWTSKGASIFHHLYSSTRKLKKIVLSLVFPSRIEIWAKPLWDAYYDESEQSFNEIAENIIDFDF